MLLIYLTKNKQNDNHRNQNQNRKGNKLES